MERLVLRPGHPRPRGVPSRIRCHFNPGELVQTRESGLRPRPPSVGDQAAGRGDIGPPGTALRFAGQGRDTLSLKLLFETGAEGRPDGDVRSLTRPLFRLAAPLPGHGETPCPVDLYWGKTWSFHGAISRIAERIDRFTSRGVATRSWVTLEVEALPRLSPRSLLTAVFGSG